MTMKEYSTLLTVPELKIQFHVWDDLLLWGSYPSVNVFLAPQSGQKKIRKKSLNIIKCYLFSELRLFFFFEILFFNNLVKIESFVKI